MRNLFLALLLANLLFAGWRLWIALPEVPARELRSPGQEPKLRVAASRRAASPATVRSSPRSGGAQAGPDDAGPAGGSEGTREASCTRIGPVADGQIADKLRAGLAGRGLQVSTVAEEGQVWVGHWVQLESVQTREEADRIVARLAAGGMPDAYVFQSAPPFSVSLGVFRDKALADKMAAAAAALGFKPQVTDRYRSGTQYWLLLLAAPAETPWLDQLARESGQILRAETVACHPAPVGAAAPIQ